MERERERAEWSEGDSEAPGPARRAAAGPPPGAKRLPALGRAPGLPLSPRWAGPAHTPGPHAMPYRPMRPLSPATGTGAAARRQRPGRR